MPTIQKASRTTQAKGLAVKRIHIVWSLCLKAFHFSSFSLTSLFISEKKAVLFLRLLSRPMVQTGVFKLGGHSMAEAGWHIFFWWGVASQEMHYCTSKQTASLCWRVWQPFEPWTKPAESETICQERKTFSEDMKPAKQQNRVIWKTVAADHIHLECPLTFKTITNELTKCWFSS